MLARSLRKAARLREARLPPTQDQEEVHLSEEEVRVGGYAVNVPIGTLTNRVKSKHGHTCSHAAVEHESRWLRREYFHLLHHQVHVLKCAGFLLQ